jgi:lysophospholipase L1-like esterase
MARAKRAGLRVLVATVPPAALIPTVDRPNQLAVNSWILTHTARDDVVNLATTLDDPSNPGELNPAYDSGDHVHPNALGDRAIGDSVSLDALER